MDIIPPNSENLKHVSKQSRAIKKRSKMDEISLTNIISGDKLKQKKQKLPYKAKAAIYISHIPHGFYEDEMNAYFNQFGKVHSAIVARSKKTGRSKGYGFVEFEDEEVAKIAAETMNNYLMFNRVLKCRYIPPEERKRRKSVRTIFPVLPKTKNRILDLNNKRNAFAALDQGSYQKKTQKKINDFKKFFNERGIDFSFKINFVNLGDSKSEDCKNLESESLTSRGSESEDDADDHFGVLEIDESDNDIHFKTPPQVKKVIKRSLRCATSSNATPNEVQRQEKRKKLKKPSIPEKGKRKTSEGKILPKGIGNKLGKKTLLKSFKPKKPQSQKKGAEAMNRKIAKEKKIKKSED